MTHDMVQLDALIQRAANLTGEPPTLDAIAKALDMLAIKPAPIPEWLRSKE